MECAFGIDIGGTQTKIGLFSCEGKLMDRRVINTDLSAEGSRIIPSVASFIKKYAEENGILPIDIVSIGVGIPGPVDRNGYVKTCVNLHWKDFYPADELKKTFPWACVKAENDANAAAFGEYKQGSGKGHTSMVLVTLGTGVGAGIIVDGRVVHGTHGIAGEIGHISVNPGETEHCNCGNKGCVDQYASATGITRMMKKISGEKECRSAETICKMAAGGDPSAARGLRVCMEALGKGLADFSHALDPEIYVIGGGVSKAGKLILDMVQEAYAANLFLTDKGAEICLAELGNDAGMTGACLLALEERGRTVEN